MFDPIEVQPGRRVCANCEHPMQGLRLALPGRTRASGVAVTSRSIRTRIHQAVHLALFNEIDVYRILQIDPRAEPFVLAAAYRALAQQYHPDGITPDIGRMAEINRAYALVRTPDDRRRYDSERLSAVGPGRVPAPTSVVVAPPSRFDGLSRRATPPGEMPSDGSSILDFGRYAGWSLRALSHHDADYLRWLMRHSSGVRYRSEIVRILPREAEFDMHVKVGR